MRLGSTAWLFAGWSLPLSLKPRGRHRRPPSHLRRQAGPPLLSTHEVRVARSGFSLPFVQTGYVRVTSRLDDAHHDIDNGRTSSPEMSVGRVCSQEFSIQPDPAFFAGGPRLLTRRS